MSSVLILLLYISFPFLCILAIPPTSRPAALAERVVFGVALYEVLLLAIGLILGLTNHLTIHAYVTFTSFAAFLLIVQSYRNGIRLNLLPAVRYFSTRRGAAALLLAFLVAVTFTLELGFDALYGNRHADGLIYHIPRVIFWAQQHNFEAWPTPVAQQIGLPVGADLILAHKILMGAGWRGIGFVTFLLSMGAIACVYVAALDLRLSRWHATMSAILFASFPAVGLRIWSVNSDIAASFPALASYIALTKIRNIRIGFAAFLLLNGTAIACKPTVAPLVLLLGCVTLWQCRHKIITIKSVALPCAAAVVAASLVLSSYWPVYMAFSDFMGGRVFRSHGSANIDTFLHSLAMHSGHWLLEPLGYLTRFKEDWEIGIIKSAYNFLGAHFVTMPENWLPCPAQDVGYTGLLSVLAVPILAIGLDKRVRIPATLLFLLSYVPLAGMIYAQPYFSRFNIVLLAGLALLWSGTTIFLRGKRRWLLYSIVALNVCALLGAVFIDIYMYKTKWSQPGGIYDYISNADRGMIANTLNGRSLPVITGGELEPLLFGPEIAFPIRYVICPADGNWEKELRVLSDKSNWLAFVHNGQKTILPGPDWERPGSHTCTEMPMQVMEEKLTAAGWKRYRSNGKVDLWQFELSPQL